MPKRPSPSQNKCLPTRNFQNITIVTKTGRTIAIIHLSLLNLKCKICKSPWVDSFIYKSETWFLDSAISMQSLTPITYLRLKLPNYAWYFWKGWSSMHTTLKYGDNPLSIKRENLINVRKSVNNSWRFLRFPPATFFTKTWRSLLKSIKNSILNEFWFVFRENVVRCIRNRHSLQI